jgi:hypothetical protein
MEEVAKIVNSVLDARGWRGKVLEQMAVELWPEVVGEEMARHTMALRFKGGVLHVRARSPQWTQELHFHEARIVTRLNGRLKQNLVNKIRCTVTPPRGIRVGALKPQWEDPSFPEAPPAPRNARPDRDDAAAHRAVELAASIEDAELRTIMENLIAASLRTRAAREAKDAAPGPTARRVQ